MYIEVLVEITNQNVDKTFTYFVPESLSSSVQVGVRVLVPFQNRSLEGFVLKVGVDKPDYKTKDVISVLDKEAVLTTELLNLGYFMKKNTLSSLISCYQTMLPKALRAKNGVEIKKKYKEYIKLVDYSYLPRGEKQNVIFEMLKKNPYIEKSLLTKVSASSVKSLLEKKVIEQLSEEVYRKEYTNKQKEDKVLTNAQMNVVVEIEKSNDTVYLLHGVTGSGKTEVYIRLIEDVIKSGKSAIVLVPEISLTEQITSRFTEKFSRVAVLHSRLSDGEKYDEYRRIKRGEVDIVIGARSAIFAPLKNIGLIILDEEHTSSFKQENNPKYHVLDIAKERARVHHSKVVLGSATPSLESYARAKKGIYHLVELKTRVNEKKLPSVHVIDMNDEVKRGNMLFSSFLINKMNEHLSSNHQVMLLLNRRGYSSFVTCKNCGYVVKCPNCDISLTYHKKSNVLRCHYCGYGTTSPRVCHECHEESLSNMGTGTEKVEEKLKELFPSYRVLRMDLDTTSTKGAHEKIITSFKNHEADILLGTQMIAKGLDFPLVTLVGVISADTSLNIPDFRSSEETFQLLMQVAGRSGRGDKEGEVCIQTFNPDHYAISYSKTHDFHSFFQKEMDIRKKLGYPPYYYLATIKVLGKNFNNCQEEAIKITHFLKEKLTNSTILGPSAAGVSKVNNIYRVQMIIKYKKEENLYKVCGYLRNHYKKNSSVKLDFDFNPYHF